ncbi:MAG: hypothetical protein IPI67_13265 [Myxococcales bacterium]|nr:hypothetical protein [Myxococcales bacterium]
MTDGRPDIPSTAQPEVGSDAAASILDPRPPISSRREAHPQSTHAWR